MNTTIKYVIGLVVIAVLATAIVTIIRTHPQVPGPGNGGAVACTMEAKLCPDGSSVGRTGLRCEFAACPGADAFAWKFGTYAGTYVTAQDWPPHIQKTNDAFSCTVAGAESERAGQTALRAIGNRLYCVTVVSEGAAGSTYRQYAYATAVGQGTQIAMFTFRFPQCMNYDEPKRSACQSEQAAFSADSLIQ